MQTAVRAWEVSLCLGMTAFSLRPSVCCYLDKGNPLSRGRQIAFRVKERTETLSKKKIRGVVSDNQMNGLESCIGRENVLEMRGFSEEYLHLFCE